MKITTFLFGFIFSGLIVIAIRCLPYKRLSRYFGHSCQMFVGSTIPSKEQLEKARNIARMIRLISRKTPWKLTCLAQALLAKYWCQQEQIPYILFIGLAKDKKLSLQVDGHAWITVGEVAVTGEHALETHQVICSYSNQVLINT